MEEEKPKKPALGFIASRLRGSFFAALMVAAVVALWLGSGYLRDAAPMRADDAAEASLKKRPLPRVRTLISIAQNKRPEIILRGGKIEAERAVTVRAEISGKAIATAAAKEGRFVKKGELLCGIAVENRLKKKEEAEAIMRLRTLKLKAAEKLTQQGHNTRIALAQSRADYNAAQTMLEQAKISLANTKITSPFDGILERLFVDEGDYMNPGAPCARVIDMSPLVISGRLTEEEIVQIKTDMSSWAVLPNGDRLEGYIRYIAHSADPKTRTYRIEMEANMSSDQAYQAVRDGLTVQIHVPLDAVRAHRIQPAILTLNANGELGLRIIINRNGRQIVRFQPVKIIAGNAADYWITGLPERAELITVGQEYVSDGVEVLIERGDENIAQPQGQLEQN